jgi:hypothetical protein
VIEFGVRRLVAPNPDDSRLRLIGVPAAEVHLNFRFTDLQRLKAWQFGALTLFGSRYSDRPHRNVKWTNTEVFMLPEAERYLELQPSCRNRQYHTSARNAAVTEREGSVLRHLFTIAAMGVNTSSARVKNEQNNRPPFHRRRQTCVPSTEVTERE